jgi:peroxiredoxin
MAIQIGQKAPDFTLKGIQGDAPVTLASYQGQSNVVLLFFPLAFTPVCTNELCSMTEDYSRYRDLGAEVLGISVDSPFSLGAFAAQEKIGINLLSDFNREASRAFDVLYEDLLGLKGVSKRAAFVIDQQGVVRYAEVCPTPRDLPNFDAIRGILETLS